MIGHISDYANLLNSTSKTTDISRNELIIKGLRWIFMDYTKINWVDVIAILNFDRGELF